MASPPGLGWGFLFGSDGGGSAPEAHPGGNGKRPKQCRFTQFRLYCPNMDRAVFLIIALATAAMAAMMTGSVAHDDFGIPLDTIRTDALSAAGLIFAAIACGSLLKRKK
jgi:hypothetical protein